MLSNTNEILNSSSRSEENHIGFGNFSKKYSEVAETNFKAKGSMIEWKLAARKSFEKMIFCRVPPIP